MKLIKKLPPGVYYISLPERTGSGSIRGEYTKSGYRARRWIKVHGSVEICKGAKK